MRHWHSIREPRSNASTVAWLDISAVAVELLTEGSFGGDPSQQCKHCWRLYTEFLTEGSFGGDPFVVPTFCAPIAPYVSAVAQTEVHNLLVTFEPQMALAADFVAGVPCHLSSSLEP